MNGSTEMLKKAMRNRTKSWQEEAQEADIEVPGTPKAPRTSTTPGIYTDFGCHFVITIVLGFITRSDGNNFTKRIF